MLVIGPSWPSSLFPIAPTHRDISSRMRPVGYESSDADTYLLEGVQIEGPQHRQRFKLKIARCSGDGNSAFEGVLARRDVLFFSFRQHVG